MILLEFDRVPAAAGYYFQALRSAAKPRSAADLPAMEARCDGVRVEAAAVAAFRRLFALTPEGPVPPTFAHVLASPLHLAVLTHPAFPLRVPGTVHLRNPIVQTRALRIGERIDLRVATGALRRTPRGTEYELVTEARAQGELVWRGVSVHLLRTGGGPGPAARPAPAELEPAWPRVWSVDLPGDTGRRYARLSGDWNPIHLSRLSAQLFGYRRAIAHGMWTCARVLAVLEPHLPAEALSLDIAFRRPVLLPGRVRIGARDDEGGRAWVFSVHDPIGTVEHALGRVLCPRAAPPGD